APPLIRFTLVRMGETEHRLVLTNHHLLLDGWSTPVLVQELLALYRERGDAAALPRLAPYRDYLAWLARQDRAAAVAAWRGTLAGRAGPAPPAAHDPPPAPRPPPRATRPPGARA